SGGAGRSFPPPPPGFPASLHLRVLPALTISALQREGFMEASFYPYLGALCWIGVLLMLGTLIRAKVPLFQKLLFPSSLIGGLIGFVLINLDLIGMPTSTGWKDITPNIFS